MVGIDDTSTSTYEIVKDVLVNLGATLAEVNHVARTRFPLFMLDYKVLGNMVAFFLMI